MADLLAIVTGASGGIGLSLAKELATRGYDLSSVPPANGLPKQPIHFVPVAFKSSIPGPKRSLK